MKLEEQKETNNMLPIDILTRPESKIKTSILRGLHSYKESNKDGERVPKSVTFTKLELPIFYSNLILIEDMKFENSNYFIRANGFVSGSIKLSSVNYDPYFDMSSCVFRIYPKTYNMNKYKVIDYIQDKSEINEEEINFKYSSEMSNNLDIVQSKFGEPIHYGDIVMLMHENSKMFVKYNHYAKKLSLSNHDSESTLFSVEPFSEIMLNDNQILKSGQPIKLKIASFSFANQNLYFSLHFPYTGEEQVSNPAGGTPTKQKVARQQTLFSSGIKNISKMDALGYLNEDDSENASKRSFLFNIASEEKEIFDKDRKKYNKEPELIVEEDSHMKWRFCLYSTFTINENLLIYGDFVSILHCDSNAFITVDQIEHLLRKEKKVNNNFNNTLPSLINMIHKQGEKTASPSHSNDKNASNLNLNESEITATNNEKSVSDVDNEELCKHDYSISASFFLKNFNYRSSKLNNISTDDVNSTWILENIFPCMRQQSFIRFYDLSKLDTYHMTFRIKNFKTNKYLSIKKIDSSEVNKFITDADMEKQGILKGSGNNQGIYYKFCLVEGEFAKTGLESNMDEMLMTEDYQYSLFGFHPSIKSKTTSSNRPEKNEFLRIYHVATKSYLKVITKKSESEEDLMKCVLTLTKYEEEKEVFKITPVDNKSQWNFRFLNSLFYLFKSVITHIEDTLSLKTEDNVNAKIITEENSQNIESNCNVYTPNNGVGNKKIKYSILKTTNYVLDKLYKFITNQFINKYTPNYDYKGVVHERQVLIAKFGFTNLFLREFIYNFWIQHDNMSNLFQLNKVIMKINENGHDAVSNLTRDEMLIYKMYKYTDSIFQFFILYCKENFEIKNELYEHLDVFFYFMNLRESCVYCLIEIFKDNSTILHSVIRDCKNKERFRRALVNIYKSYFVKRLTKDTHNIHKLKSNIADPITTRKESVFFNQKNMRPLIETEEDEEEIKDSDIDEDINIIDLIFEFVKISKYERTSDYNNRVLLHKYISETSAVSLITRDKYFELLKAMVSIKNGSNILENQRCIIEKMLINAKDVDDTYKLVKYLEKKIEPGMGISSDYPPCLKELLFNVADENPDENIQRFLVMHENFDLEKLISTHTYSSTSTGLPTSSFSKQINPGGVHQPSQVVFEDPELLAVNLKLICYMIEYSEKHLKYDPNANYKSFSSKIKDYFNRRIQLLDKNFTFDSSESGGMNPICGKINYRNKSEVNLLISNIQFVKTIYEHTIFSENDNRKQERKLISNLMNFITSSFYYFKENKFSSLIQGEMTKKHLTLRERIVKSDRMNYLSIAESWLNVYLVYKNALSKLIDEEDLNGAQSDKRKSKVSFLRHSGVSLLRKAGKRTMKHSIRESYKERESNMYGSASVVDNFNPTIRTTVKNENNEEHNKQGFNSTMHGSMSRENNQKEKDKVAYETEKIQLVKKRSDSVVNLFGDMKKSVKITAHDFYSIEDLHENNKRMVMIRAEEEKERLTEIEEQQNMMANKRTTFLHNAKGKTSINYNKRISQVNSVNHVKSYKVDYDYQTNNENFIEDERKRNKNEVMKNILHLFKLFIKKNIRIMKDNFSEYFKSLPETTSNANFDHMYTQFIQHCMPNLNSGIRTINSMIQDYSEIEGHFTSKVDITPFYNMNLLFENKKNEHLNFIHNLVIAFNITEDIEIQEHIVNLIYIYFSQRKVFLHKVMSFNDHLVSSQYKEKLVKLVQFNDETKIKSEFMKFYHSYEKSKHEYSDDDPKAIDNFFSILHSQLISLFRKILIYWKYEFRTLSLENVKKYYSVLDENEALISEIEHYIFILNNLETLIADTVNMFVFNQISYLKLMEDIINMFYFIRNNINNPVFLSVSTILNQNESTFVQFYFSLMRDFLEKGKKIVKKFQEKFLLFFIKPQKDQPHDTIFDLKENKMKKLDGSTKECIKNKYFSCFIMMITLQIVSVPRYKKSSEFLNKIYENYKEVLNNDSISTFLLLLTISDIQKDYLALEYFTLMERMKESNKHHCFGTLLKANDMKEQSSILFPNQIVHLYLDILINVLKYVVYKGKIILEANLDEIIVDNILFLLKKINGESFYQSEGVFKVLSVLKYVARVENLNKIFKIKIDPSNKNTFDAEYLGETNYMKFSSDGGVIVEHFPRPDELFDLFKFNIENTFDTADIHLGTNNNNYQGAISTNCSTGPTSINIFLKRSCNIYSYLLFYVTEVSPGYFTNPELDKNKSEIIENIRNLILFVFYGYNFIVGVEKDLNESMATEKINYDFIQNADDSIKSFFDNFACSHLFVVLNALSIEFVKFGENRLGFIPFDVVKINKNFNKVTNDFMSKVEKDTTAHTGIFLTATNKESENGASNRNFNQSFMSFYFTVCKLKKIYKSEKINLEGFVTILQKKKKILKELLEEGKKSRKEKCLVLKEMLWNNKHNLNSFANSETSSFIYYLIYLIDLDNNQKFEYENILYTFLNKVIEFIHKSSIYNISGKRVKLNCFLLFIIKEFIGFFEKNENDRSLNLKKKTLKDIQIIIERSGIAEKGLDLVCHYNISEIQDMMPFIFDAFCSILKKGNSNSQESFYGIFTMKNQYEPVFRYIFSLISNKIESIVSNKSNIIRNKRRKVSIEHPSYIQIYNDDMSQSIDSIVLQFLQLLCENHNRKLQLFLHNQKNFRKTYDLVSLTQNFLTMIFNNFEPFLFDPLVKCFDLLIEFIQGPCLENQLALINSKLLITIEDILSYYIEAEFDKLKEHYPKISLFQKKDTKDLYATNLRNTNSNSSTTRANISQYPHSRKASGLNFYKLTTPQISLLAFKSSILLLALIENRTKDDKIYSQIMSNIKPSIVKAVYDKIYFEHSINIEESNNLEDNIIRIRDLNRVEAVVDLIKDEKERNSPTGIKYTIKDYLILETGFNLYFLDQYFQDYESNLSIKASNSMSEALRDKRSNIFHFFFDSVFYSFFVFLKALILSVAQMLSMLITILLFLLSFGKCWVKNIVKSLLKRKKRNLNESTMFYEKCTRSIEVLRDETVYKIYFYLYPYCKSLNKFEKTRFLEGIDRTNSKTKLMDILKYSNQLKYELEYDYKIKNLFNYFPTLGAIFKSNELWKDLSLILNLVQNFFDIFAVYKVPSYHTVCLKPTDCFQITTWKDEKSYFGLYPSDFQDIIDILSYIQCALAGMIVVEFLARKTPAIYMQIREELSCHDYSPARRRCYFIKEFIMRTFLNFEIIYYLAYMAFALVGCVQNDFFFAFLLLEVIQRFKTLRNVVMAIRNPFKELILTFILWIILIYYFSLLGYAFFRNDFPYSGDCNSLVNCLATIFYQNNKVDNGIGGYLHTIEISQENKNPLVARFWYDQLFNLLLKILIIQMIAGIIIDNFAKLRRGENEMLSDMKNVCTICGLRRDEVEKIYDKRGKTYDDHVKKDHEIFNYIHYIIYLFKKDPTEYTGMESYISDLAFQQKDITWFPLDKIYLANQTEMNQILEKTRKS